MTIDKLNDVYIRTNNGMSPINEFVTLKRTYGPSSINRFNLFTAITIGCGFKGGEVVPSFFVGAAFGCVAAGWLGLPAGFGAAMGLVSVFCGAVNCPLASIILSVELFGSGDLLYFAMACSISYLISGYCGLYSSQTILYSKLRAEFINVHTKE